MPGGLTAIADSRCGKIGYDEKKENGMGDLGFWPLLHLAALVYAAIQIFDSSADTTKKVIWILVVGLFPIIGLIVWFFIGPGTPKK